MFKNAKKLLIITLVFALVAVTGGIGSVAAVDFGSTDTATANVTFSNPTYTWEISNDGEAEVDEYSTEGVIVNWSSVVVEVSQSDEGIKADKTYAVKYDSLTSDGLTLEVEYNGTTVSQGSQLTTGTLEKEDPSTTTDLENFTITCTNATAGQHTFTLTLKVDNAA